MRTNTTRTSRSRAALLAFAATLMLTLRASLAVAAPDPAAWGESSGYDALEANRAAAALVTASAPQSGEAVRVAMAREALASGDIGGVQEEALSELVVAADAGSAIAPVDERVTAGGRIR